MFNKFLKVIKNIIISVFTIYAFNLLAAPINIIIPINVITIMLVCIFGIPALLALIILFVTMF